MTQLIAATAKQVEKELKTHSTPARKTGAQSYFKTGKGEYGFGDVFIGVTVPDQRKTAKKFAHLPLSEIKKLLQSKMHECQLTALLILTEQYRKADDNSRKMIAKFYLANKKGVNNWDLVDSSASYILGHFLLHKSRNVLYRLAKSRSVWDRRIAIIATMAFIRENDFDETLKIAEMLLHDKHDLIHKASGWTLRETGEKSPFVLKGFLEKHATQMPRTMLRYAIEKFPEKERKKFLAMKSKRS